MLENNYSQRSRKTGVAASWATSAPCWATVTNSGARVVVEHRRIVATETDAVCWGIESLQEVGLNAHALAHKLYVWEYAGTARSHYLPVAAQVATTAAVVRAGAPVWTLITVALVLIVDIRLTHSNAGALLLRRIKYVIVEAHRIFALTLTVVIHIRRNTLPAACRIRPQTLGSAVHDRTTYAAAIIYTASSVDLHIWRAAGADTKARVVYDCP